MPLTRADLKALQAAATGADAALASANAELAAAQAAWAALQGTTATPRRVIVARNRLWRATSDATVAQGDASAKRAQLNAALDGLIGQLDSGVPLALLPVRLETRFRETAKGSGKFDLLVRIYPDDIHSFSHQSGLTADEAATGRHFWNEWWRAGKEPDPATQTTQWSAWRNTAEACWRQAVQHLGTARALWVVQTLTPTNLGAMPASPTARDTPLPVSPVFPAAVGGTSAPAALCLPDRFVAAGFKNGARIFSVWGDVVADPLPLGPDPGVASPTPMQSDWYLWKTDFDRAVAAGMGIRVDSSLVPSDRHIDLLVVYGFRGTGSATEAGAELTQLLTGHLHTWGFDLVAQGTPTNNTQTARSSYQRSDPSPADTLSLLRANPPAAGSDGDLLAGALDLPSSLVSLMQHAGSTDQADARAMNRVAWSSWWAYFCRRLLGDVFGGWDAREHLLPTWRDYFVDHVRARGPLPAFRVGNQPYGVAVTSSLDRWDVDAALLDIVVVRARSQGGQSPPVMALGWDSRGSAPAAWSDLLPMQGFPDATLLRGVAVTGIERGERPRYFVLEIVPGAGGGAFLRSSKSVDTNGLVMGGWTGRQSAKLGVASNTNCAIAAIAAGNDASKLVVLYSSPAGTATRLFLQVGRNLDDEANAAGGWSNRVDTGITVASGSRALGIGLGYLGSTQRLDAVVVAAVPQGVPGHSDERIVVFVGLDIDDDGVARGGWSKGYAIPDLGGGAVSACVSFGSASPSGYSRMAVYVSGPRLGAGRPDPSRLAVAVGDIRELAGAVNVNWSASAQSGMPGSGPALLTAGHLGRSPKADLLTETGRINLLSNLRDAWREQIDSGTVPSLGYATAPAGPDAIFLQLLASDASATSVAVRSLLGPQLVRNLWKLTGNAAVPFPATPYLQELQQQASEGWRQAGLDSGGFDPKNVWLTRAAFAEETTPFTGPLVQLGSLSESDPLQPGYIDWLVKKDASGYRDPEEIHSRAYLAELKLDGRTEPLLLKVLRHALLNGYLDAALRQPVAAGSDTGLRDAWLGKKTILDEFNIQRIDINAIDPELIDAVDLVVERAPAVGTGLTRWGYMKVVGTANPPQAHGERLRAAGVDAELDALRTSMEHLATRPSAILSRLLSEAFDLATYRIDAWMTSIYSRRMASMRATRPHGIALGAWGFVENLVQSNQAPNGGFVHAPSINQATTAAVLRGAWLSHGGLQGTANPFSVDLSSARVRCALELLEGVRHGQPLSALLGYQLERGLHVSRGTQVLDPYIAPLRAKFPLAANKLTEGQTGEPQESVAARNVVDGLALLRDWDSDPALLDTLFPSAPQADKDAVKAELSILRDTLDAVSDLGVAESVYQAIRGNSSRAGATLDSLSKGTLPPPEMEFVQTPRTGVAVTHRIVVPIEGGASATDANLDLWGGTGAVSATRMRRVAEPALSRWVASLLGNPARVKWRIAADDGTVPAATPNRSLADIGLSPLDFLALCGGNDRESQSQLDLLLAYDAQRNRPASIAVGAKLKVLLDRDASWSATHLTLPELMAVARLTGTLVAEAAPADARHFSVPGVAVANTALSELAGRANVALQSLETALQSIYALFSIGATAKARLAALIAAPDTAPDNLLKLSGHLDIAALTAAIAMQPPGGFDAVRATLLALWYAGIPDAMPRSASGDDADARATLLRQARSVWTQGRRRADSAQALLQAVGVGNRVIQAKDYFQVFEAIFGRAFRVLPRFTLNSTMCTELTQALALRTAVGDAPRKEVLSWFRHAARVRPGVARLEKAYNFTEGAGSSTQLGFEIAQLPLPDSGNDRWVARDLTAGTRVPGGRVSIALNRGLGAAAFNSSDSLAGMIVDEWLEVIPNSSETTAITLHYDAPGAAAPNVVLLAVPPVLGAPWTLTAIESVLLDTIRAGKTRAVDPDSMPGKFGHFLPATYFALNAGDSGNGDTVATDFRP